MLLVYAYRMLDEHFMDQMNELIRLCPRGRQTMLFSATMTDEVQYVCVVLIMMYSHDALLNGELH